MQQTHLPHRELISLQSGVDGGDSAVGYGGGHLAHLLDPDVTCGVHTGDRGLHFLVGDDIAILERELTIHLGVGGHTGVHKDAAAGVLDILLDPALPLAWRHQKKLAGSGALGDQCSHLLSVSQMVLGDMDEVMGMQSIVIPERPIRAGSTEMGKVENDDLITFLVKYKNGAIGDFSASRVATGRKNYFYYEIQGTEGTVAYNLERMCEVQVYFKSDADKDNGRDCGFRTVLLNPQHEGFRWFQPAGGIAISFDDMKTLQAHALMQAMQGKPYLCDFEMGAKVDGVISAVLRSIASGQWEKC